MIMIIYLIFKLLFILKRTAIKQLLKNYNNLFQCVLSSRSPRVGSKQPIAPICYTDLRLHTNAFPCTWEGNKGLSCVRVVLE